jgi:hypothetical protein
MELRFRITITVVSIVSLLFVYDVLFGISPYVRSSLLGFASYASSATTSNVTVSGTIGAIRVYFFPVNFTTVTPGANCNKASGFVGGNITVEVNASTNVAYNIYLNGTNLVATGGNPSIAVANVHFSNESSSCPAGDTDLSTTYVTNTTAFTGRPYNVRNTTIYFWIDTPTGYLNQTYNGNLTIFVNGTSATNNETWTGMNNLTLIMDKNVELSWAFVPVNFSSLIPGQGSNAMTNQGNPSNLSIDANTNIRVDAYVNGSNLTCLAGGGCTVGTHWLGMGNLSYTNLSAYTNFITQLSDVYKGFGNWNNTGNSTGVGVTASDLLSYWNITIPSGQIPGGYGGSVTGKAVDRNTAA